MTVYETQKWKCLLKAGGTVVAPDAETRIILESIRERLRRRNRWALAVIVKGYE